VYIGVQIEKNRQALVCGALENQFVDYHYHYIMICQIKYYLIIIIYSCRLGISVVFAIKNILIKYIKIYIDIYGTKLISLDRYLDLVFYKI
jgi:hypothetical protein